MGAGTGYMNTRELSEIAKIWRNKLRKRKTYIKEIGTLILQKHEELNIGLGAN